MQYLLSGFLLMISISLCFSNVDDPIADRSQGHELPCGGYPDGLFTELTDKDKDTYQCNIWYVRPIDRTIKPMGLTKTVSLESWSA